MQRCLSANTVAEYFSGSLGAELRDRVDEHTDRCADCRALLAAVAPSANDAVPISATPASTAGHRPCARQLEVGQLVAGRYRVVRMVGRGGMGEVYETIDELLDERVALKTIRADRAGRPGAASRFQRELQLARKVTHPNVCRVFDVAQHSDGPGEPALFMTMALVEGETLADRLGRGPLSPSEALPLARQMALGLGAAHAAGVVHRDFKPHNVMLCPVGDGRQRVVITDFGLAAALALDETTAGAATDVVGTPSYMAPEQRVGAPPTPRVDLYALGVVLFQMLTGELPFAERDWVRRVPGGYARTVEGCLRLDPALRFGSAADVLRSLDRPPSRRRWPAIAAVLVLVMALATGRAALHRRAHPPGGERSGVVVLRFHPQAAERDERWLDTALSELVRAELGAGGSVPVIPGEVTTRLERDLGLADVARPSHEVIARVARVLGVRYVVLGGYRAQGDGRVRVEVSLVDPTAGEQASWSGSGDDRALPALVAPLSRALRSGLRLADLGGADATVGARALPTNAEAVRLYAEGLAHDRDDDWVGARAALERARDLEPAFAGTHLALAQVLWKLEDIDRAQQEAKLARDSSTELSRAERLAIEATYWKTIGRYDKAVEVQRALYTFFPDRFDYGLQLADLEIDGRRDEQARVTLAALRQRPAPDGDSPAVALLEARLAMRNGDSPAMLAAARRAGDGARALGERHALAEALWREAEALGRLGRDDDALAVWRRALTAARDVGNQALEARALSEVGRMLNERGQLDEARADIERAVTIARRAGMPRVLASTLTMQAMVRDNQGDFAGARALTEEALALYTRLKSVANQAQELRALAEEARAQGKLDESLAFCDQQLRLCHGEPFCDVVARIERIHTLLDRGDLSEADAALAKFPSVRPFGVIDGPTDGRLLLGRLRLLQGRSSAAEAAWRAALAGTHDPPRAEIAALGLGAVALAAGRATEARAKLGALATPARLARAEGDEIAGAAAELLARDALARGDIESAADLAAKAQVASRRTALTSLRLQTQLTLARAQALRGERTAAAAAVERVRAEASAAGMVPMMLEAEWTAAAMTLRAATETADGAAARRARSRLRAVARRARALGLGELAGRARATR